MEIAVSPDLKVPMTCPKCGARMNHHADKLVEPVDSEGWGRRDSVLGGLLHEMHACPRCGNVESRPAPSTN
jgi:ribosomal protein S27AE